MAIECSVASIVVALIARTETEKTGQRNFGVAGAYLHRLPKTAQALNDFVEPREDFFIRRVRWTESTFIQESRCPTYHQFEVRAGTRTKTGSAPKVQAAIHSALRNLQSVVAA